MKLYAVNKVQCGLAGNWNCLVHCTKFLLISQGGLVKSITASIVDPFGEAIPGLCVIEN